MYKFNQFALFCLFCFLAASSPIVGYDDWYDMPSQISVEEYLARDDKNDERVRPFYGHQRKSRRYGRPFMTELQKYKESLKSFYQWDTALNFSVSLGLGAALANTSCDGNFGNWYQDNARSSGTDDWGRIFKTFGEGNYMIPAYFVTSFAYRYLDEYWELDAGCGKNFGEWASRSSRAILVGFPPLLLGQSMIGASRPGERSCGSQWRLFDDDNGISGHAFIGAIPFITAAQMTDRIWLKSLFYFGSTLTCWSRINGNEHYLSQVLISWYLAYLSCRAVARAENPNLGRGITVFPLITTDTVGVGICFRR